MHGASKDWLRLGVGGTENADVSPGTIWIGTAFVGSVVVAANGFVLRGACLTFGWRGWGREGWIPGRSGWGLLWWRAHVQGMQVLVDSCPCVRVHRLLMRLEMVDEVQEDAFEVVPFKTFPHYEH